MQEMEHVIIGADPHKLSATIETVDIDERLFGSSRFSTDQAGYAAMRKHAKTWPDRVWAVEGANGVGRPLAQRLLEAVEHVVDASAKLAATVRLFDTGRNCKTDLRDAHSISIVAVRTEGLRVLKIDVLAALVGQPDGAVIVGVGTDFVTRSPRWPLSSASDSILDPKHVESRSVRQPRQGSIVARLNICWTSSELTPVCVGEKFTSAQYPHVTPGARL